MQPKIGISACLLGQRVRHNGEHKRNNWLVDVLGPHVSWVPICPELEMGLGVPRETLRLVHNNPESHTGQVSVHLLSTQSQKDYTLLAQETSQRIIATQLLNTSCEIDSYIFKKDSPSCGLERVKVYGKNNIPAKSGVGIFAQSVVQYFPNIPMIEEGRLGDFSQREAFLTRLYAWARFRRISQTIPALQAYHQQNKLLFMAYDPRQYSALGRLAANSENINTSEVFQNYSSLLAGLLKKPNTSQKNINVLQHILGYFKALIGSKEKLQILKTIEAYRHNEVPLISLLTLFEFLIQKHSLQYLQNQTFLEPFPRSLH